MKFRTRFASNFAASVLGLMIVIGFALHLVAIPVLSQELEYRYVEYRGDRELIQWLLSSIVGFGQLALGVVVYLLLRLKGQRLLESSSANAVRLLIAALLGVAGTVVGLLGWLIAQNTMPPALLLLLVLSICVALAVALVTVALLEVLREAIVSKEELAGVI
jgi:hypothetical protein